MTLLSTKPKRRESWLSDLFNAEDFFPQDWLARKEEATIPPVNVRENEQEYTLELALPGLEKTDIHLEVKNGGLMITGSREEEKTEEGKDEFTHREFNYRSFTRSFTLPEDVLESGITARFDNGLLTIVLPRTATNKETGRSDIKIS